MMYCNKCGNELKPETKVCPKCGNKVTDDNEPVTLKAVRNKQKVLQIVAGICLFLLLIGLGVGLGLLFCRFIPEDSGEVVNPSEVNEGQIDLNEGEENEEESDVNPQSLLAQRITTLNNGTSQQEEILISEEHYGPAPQNKQAKWDNTFFYTLEDINPDSSEDGKINGYNLEKKLLINGETKNKIEYEIYRHPATDKVNKIVSIENKGEYLDITEYYYRDDGKIDFIFKKKDINYIPSYATPDVDGERYYFSQDNMVKWRIVSGGRQTNYLIGNNEKARGGNAGDVYLFDNLGSEEQSNYLLKEKQMINAAYNTYQFVLVAKGTSQILGYVKDEQGNSLSGTTVKLLSEEDGSLLYECQTDEAGCYAIIVPPEDHTYRIVVSKNGYVETTIYQICLDTQLIGSYQETVYLVSKKEEQIYNIQLTVSDAFNVYGDGMAPLSDAKLIIRKGINNRTGEIYEESRADSYGRSQLNLEPGSYTVEINKEGYIVSYYTLVARQDNEYIEMNTSPTLGANEVRIVLTWGSFPEDLDAHLFTPYNHSNGDTTYHIWYGNMTDANANDLDIDDMSAYGPETMTINHLGDGLYKYYVSDYTNCIQDNTMCYDMSLSGARVAVYSQDGLVQTFYVPTSRPGVIWEVFEIRNKKIIPLQHYYYNIADKTWWNNEK